MSSTRRDFLRAGAAAAAATGAGPRILSASDMRRPGTALVTAPTAEPYEAPTS